VLSAAGLFAVTAHEGFTDRAVIPVPGDVPTYGHGSTRRPDGTPVQLGDRITRPEAADLMKRELRGFEGRLKDCVTAPLTQGEYDSLVSLAYNVGSGTVCKSTMVRLHNAGQHAQACAQFDRWTYFQGKDCRIATHRCSGLVTRRADERKRCES
jgi:lysozyme